MFCCYLETKENQPQNTFTQKEIRKSTKITNMSKILLTGATGYVGGTVLALLLASNEPSLNKLTIDVLIRDSAKASKLKEAYGDRINTVAWTGGLEDTKFIEETAANYDIIVNTGSGFIPEGAVAFVNGLARRVKNGSPAPWLIHISGCKFNLLTPRYHVALASQT